MGQTQSYAIPRYSPIAINFDVEYDQNNDKIFGIGIYVKMFIHSKLSYHAVFDNLIFFIPKLNYREILNTLHTNMRSIKLI